MHTVAQKAWLAGFIDGEGYIGITTLQQRNGRRRHYLHVVVTNTHIATLDSIVAEWGGRLHKRERNTDKGWRTSGQVAWSTQQATALLKEVLPYLRTKKEQAKLAIKFSSGLIPAEHQGRGVTDTEWDQREQLRGQIKVLNGRFPRKPPEPRIKPMLTCARCSKEFNDYIRVRKYCSIACTSAAGRDFYNQRNLVEKVCLRCGTTFHARSKKQMYCSWICGRHGGMDKWKESIAAKKRAAPTE